MDFYQAYRSYNLRLARGGGRDGGRNGSAPRSQAPAVRRGGDKGGGQGNVRYPRLAVYVGRGSSHSWLWFAQLFERLGLYDLAFLDQDGLAAGDLAGRDLLAISGGDTFGLAAAMGGQGARALEAFIKEGGLYLGSCAGAYLPLNSSKEPLNLFNWVPAKITNLSRHLPRASDLPEKFCTPYGCSFVYHPVREAVRLVGCGRPPWTGAGEFEAPLYGGPAMVTPQVEMVLARYQSFTSRTRFLTDPELAAETLLQRAAVLRARLGQGVCYLFGPHFEHPHFPRANLLVADAIYWDLPERKGAAAASAAGGETLQGRAARLWLRDLKRQVSNTRLVALGLEDHPARWLIGRKVYEPAKLRVFAEAVWSRLRRMERRPRLLLPPGAGELPAAWQEVTRTVRQLHAELRQGGDTLELASGLFAWLNLATARFLESYFHDLRAELAEGQTVPNAA